MARVSEGIGKTYDEAVQDGLNKIGLSKSEVSIEIVKEPKKTFFSILEPRQVKVIVTEIEKAQPKNEKTTVEKREIVDAKPEDIEAAKKKIEKFLRDYFEKLEIELDVESKYEEHVLKVDINGEKAGLIIGYRGETLEALQMLISTMINRGKDVHIKVLIDAENYRKKRAKTLEELALKIASTVVSKRKSFALEPMVAFERKIIHETLQNHPKVKTSSTGEEPYRKVVISLK
ncbi:MAG: KH domain-containing protein [Clostridia bacterium]|nr:KH domain-containing protein [Clostridia bacterium]